MDFEEHKATPAVCVPIPPRYWWLKRIAIAALVCIVLLVGLRIGWGWYADAKLRAAIERIQAAGEPIFPEDFNTPPIPDDENAAVAWRRAASALQLTDEELELAREIRWTDTGRRGAEFDGIASKCEDVLPLIRRARSLRKINWDRHFESPVIGQDSALVDYSWPVGRALVVYCVAAHDRGDDDACVDTLRSLLAFAGAVSQDAGSYFYVDALNTDILTARLIERAAPNLQVATDTGAAEDGLRPATRSSVQQLIVELLEEDSCRSGFQQRIHFDRMLLLDAIRHALAEARRGDRHPADRTILELQLNWFNGIYASLLLSPALELDGERLLAYSRDLLVVERERTWPAALDQLLRQKQMPGTRFWALARYARPISFVHGSGWRWVFVRRFQAMAVRRMAAIALAIRLYELDHGARPPVLEALLDGYLRSLPLDPFQRAGQFHYVPEADAPRLYSVGENQVDDGGTRAVSPSGGLNKSSLDILFFLNNDGHGASPGKQKVGAGG